MRGRSRWQKRSTILGGKVQLFRRPNGERWHCRASIGGKQHRHSTKQASLASAKDVAEDWYLTLKGKVARGEAVGVKTFKYAAERFFMEFKVLTQGQRSPMYVRRHQERLDLYLIPFFREKALTEITSGMFQDYRIDRMSKGGFDKRKEGESADPKKRPRNGKPPSRSTLHQEIVCLRQVLKFARRHGWLELMPDLADPYRDPARFRTGRGSRLPSTSSSTRPRATARKRPKKSGGAQRAKTCWTTSSFR